MLKLCNLCSKNHTPILPFSLSFTPIILHRPYHSFSSSSPSFITPCMFSKFTVHLQSCGYSCLDAVPPGCVYVSVPALCQSVDHRCLAVPTTVGRACNRVWREIKRSEVAWSFALVLIHT